MHIKVPLIVIVSDLFWRITDRISSTPVDFFELECTRLNPGGYSLTDTNIDSAAGIGSTVAYVGATGVVTFYPAGLIMVMKFQRI